MTALSLAGLLPSLLLTAGWYLFLRRARASMWRLALISLPSTLAHELAHFVVGFFLLAQPADFSVWPKRSGDRWTLGSVSFRRINVLNGAFVALAPCLFLPLAWVGLTHLAAPLWAGHRWGWWLASGYLMAAAFFAASPSAQDLKQGSPSFLFYAVIGGAWWLFGAPAWRGWFH